MWYLFLREVACFKAQVLVLFFLVPTARRSGMLVTIGMESGGVPTVCGSEALVRMGLESWATLAGKAEAARAKERATIVGNIIEGENGSDETSSPE